jgi:hypothetical protein
MKIKNDTKAPDDFVLPEFVRGTKHVVYAKLIAIRSRHLRDRNLTVALETICDLVVAEYRASGKDLTEESINHDIANATVSLAAQVALRRTNAGPYAGDSSISRNGVKTSDAQLADFDYRMRLKRKLDLLSGISCRNIMKALNKRFARSQ